MDNGLDVCCAPGGDCAAAKSAIVGGERRGTDSENTSSGDNVAGPCDVVVGTGELDRST